MDTPVRIQRLGLFLAAAFAPLGIERASAALPLEPVAIRGEVAPGVLGASFSLFGSPLINQQGDVAFHSSMSNAGNAEFAIWVGKRNDLQMVIREGDPMPGTNGKYFSDGSGVELRALAENRATLFVGYREASDPDSANYNYATQWAGTPGDLHYVISDNLPNYYMPYPLVDRQGNLTYSLDPGTIYHGAAGNLQSFSLVGTSAPGADNDQFAYASAYYANSRGQIVISGSLKDPADPTQETGAGYWLYDTNTTLLQKVKLGPLYDAATDHYISADIAPGFTAPFGNTSSPTLNDHGVVAFAGNVNTGGTATGIWMGKPGALQLIAKSGATAPVPGPSVAFANFSGVDTSTITNPELNGRDQIAFVAKLAGATVTTANDRAMFLASSSTDIRLIAREGDHAPGTPDGVVFQQFSNIASIPYAFPSMNSRGQTVFYGILTGPGVTTSNDVGIWATSTLGESYLIAREGQQVQLTAGLSGVISSISFRGGTGGQEGRSSGLNDAGQVAFSIRLSNPSIPNLDSAVVIVQIPDLAADFNGDKVVDGLDLTAWSEHVGFTPATRALGDANGDGAIDGADFLYWQSTVGQTSLSTPATAQVPEPSTLALLAATLAPTLIRRRAHRRGAMPTFAWA